MASILTINNDILESILMLLPYRDLVNMSLVCRDVLSVIKNPCFVSYYRREHNFPILGILWNKDDFFRSNTMYNYLPLYWTISSSAPFQRLDFANGPSGLFIVASCNGLFLCRTCDNCYFLPSYYVYNPFTSRYKVLPSSPSEKKRSSTLRSVSLAFEPANSPYYKVVFVWYNKTSSRRFSVEIFYSENSSWVCCGDGCIFPFHYMKSGVFWKGILNWIGDGGSLLCFDMDKQVTREIGRNQNSLTQWRREKKVNCFGVFGGVLRFIEIYKNRNAFDIYDMQSNYSSFILKSHCELEVMDPSDPRLPNGSISVLYMDDSIGIIILGEKIFIIDFREQKCEQWCDTHQEHNHSSDSFSVFQYIESSAEVCP
ncbi:F-box protein At5g07610-like [Papaver somniferum]|uniref:F-box protein At5g07610-like n=1 Tax=Papaver somniferum TaxID=3469 RepID=UPI000E6FC8EB|nr:F-box protein At5g07610-like [Papaver somniferum]